MNWFKKMSVGAKLTGGFSIMILLMGFIGLSGYLSAGKINQELDEIYQIRLPSLDFLIEADRDLQQLLVAERSMIFANVKSDVFKTLVNDYEENLRQSDERWKKYKALTTAKEERELFPKYEKAREEWQAVSRKVVDGRLADTRHGRRLAIDLSLGSAKEKFETMRNYLDQLTMINLKVAEDAHLEAGAIYSRTLVSLITITCVGLFIGLLLTWMLNRGISLPLKQVISGLDESADQVSSASGQISSASQTLADGSSQQAASLEETSSSLEEMATMTRQNAENAAQANGLMSEANHVVEKANTAMDGLTASIEDISKASEETSKIIKTIDEIAFQTNLLALNAAVEAARAGEAGAGFAVVADEVRNLALRAADAAKDTADLIEGTVKKIKAGSQLVNDTNAAFSEVADSTVKVGDLVAEIAAASGEQAQGIDQVNKAVSDMDQLTQQNAANAEESASASEEMSAQSEQMKAMVLDLAAVVSGHRNGNGNGARFSVTDRLNKTEKSKTIAIPHTNPVPERVALSGVKQVSPGQVIPLEDAELKDF
jgi:methyl-accepting chemotaxis protein